MNESSLFKVFIGHKSVNNRQVIDVDDTNLYVGQLVAIFQEAGYDRIGCVPIIGEVVELTTDNNDLWVKIHLLAGSYTGKWKKTKKMLRRMGYKECCCAFRLPFHQSWQITQYYKR